jgi:hypothetical protein
VVPKGSTSLKTLNKIEKFVKPKELKVSFSLIFTIFSLEVIFLSMAPFKYVFDNQDTFNAHNLDCNLCQNKTKSVAKTHIIMFLVQLSCYS